MDKETIKTRLDFKKAAYTKLTEAYLAIVDGGVKTYQLDDRSLTKLDLGTLKKEIDELENQIDVLESMYAGKKPRKTVGIIPRDW